MFSKNKNPRLRGREFNIDSQKANLIACATGFILSVGLLTATYMSYNNYQTNVKKMETELSELKGKYNDLKSETSDVDVKTIQQRLNSAKELGEKVAELQNTWGTALNPSDEEEAKKGGGQSADAINTTRIKELKRMFGDSAGSKEWYMRNNDTKSMNVKWVFITTTSFATTKQNVMWQAKTESGDLYAYTTALYDAVENKFSNVEVHITSVGEDAQTAKMEG